jgi:hypothetical protein
MRTKTLVLTALSSLSALGLMAQTSTNVYSLNAVGYINVTVPPGFTIVADQLWASGGNVISNVLNDASGAFDNITYFKWTGTQFNFDTGDSALGGWTGTGATDTLNPGEAVWIQNPRSTNITITFVGTVPQGTNNLSIPVGFSMISSIVPQAGLISTTLGFTNGSTGDTVFQWNGSSYIDGGDTYDPALGGWSPNEPNLAVGQGVWYQATAAVTWSRVFSVNQ